MLIEFANLLPSRDSEFELAWAKWQIQTIRTIVHQSVYDSTYFLIDGCEEQKLDEWPTCPDDHPKPDSVAVFYYDGDEDQALLWRELCQEAIDMIRNNLNWSVICPKNFVMLAQRFGLKVDPFFRELIQPKRVGMTREERDEMELAKSDHCNLKLAQYPLTKCDVEPEFFNDWIRSYIDFMVGEPPNGVQVCYLWESSERWIVKQTGRPSKVHSGWGLDYSPNNKKAALEFAEKWRLAFYTFVGAIDWPKISCKRIYDMAVDWDIIEETP